MAAGTPKRHPSFDVFISYRHDGPCGTWAREVLAPQLRRAGVAVCIDVDSFRLGAPLILEMARAVEESRYTLAVLSPAYLQSTYTELEGVLAEHLGLETSQRRLLVIRREPCAPRLGMRALLWLDMRDDEETEHNMDRLVAAIRPSPVG